MRTIKNDQAIREYVQGTAVIVDVREPAEFQEVHIPCAVNLPSTKFNIENFVPFKNHKVCIVCQSGRRSKKTIDKLIQHGWTNVYYLENQMNDYSQTVLQEGKGWTVDRQFRMTLGILLAVFLVGNYFISTRFFIVPIILCVGLIFTSIIDRCYMRMGIAMLPWNRNKRK